MDADARRARDWDVLLIGGASGTGKSTVANVLARRFGVPVTPVDDIVTALLTLSTPEQQPVLHRFWTEPGAFDWPAERIVEHTSRWCASSRQASAPSSTTISSPPRR